MLLFFFMRRRPPKSTRTDTRFPVQTLCRADLFRFTQATAARAIAIGNAAQVHAEEAVALGVKTRVLAGADRAVAIGSDSVASEADTVSFGHLATDEDEFTGGTYGSDLQRRLVNVADGIGDHDAATMGQL